METAYYKVNVEDLISMFNAKKVEIKIIGDRYFITEKFRYSTKKDIGRFLSYFNYINLSDDVSVKDSNLDEVAEQNKNKKNEQKLIKKAMNKELYSSKLFYAGNSFVIIGGIGVLSGAIVNVIGSEISSTPVNIAGASFMLAFLPLIPLSSVFYIRNYIDVKKKYYVESSAWFNKDKIYFAINVNF